MVTRFHARDTPDDRTLSIIVVPSCIFSFSLLVNYLRSFHLRLFPPPLLRASPRHDQLLVRTFPDSFPPHPSTDQTFLFQFSRLANQDENESPYFLTLSVARESRFSFDVSHCRFSFARLSSLVIYPVASSTDHRSVPSRN